jgi:nucleoside-diphosphate-sugar epimerase
MAFRLVNRDVEGVRRTVRLGREGQLLDPIVVNGSTSWLGDALAARLARCPMEIRLVDDGDDLSAACDGASCIVHLDAPPRRERVDDRAKATFDSVLRVTGAVEGSTVERIIYVSTAGASEESPFDLLRAKAEAEACLQSLGRDSVIFRCTHIFGPPDDPGEVIAALLADSRGRVAVVGSGRQRVAPVYREDVLDAIVGALDPRTYHGRFDLPGPESMTMDQLARVVNGDKVAIRHLPARAQRIVARRSGLDADLFDLMALDSLGEQTRADRTFGLERRGVSQVYAPATSLRGDLRRARAGRARRGWTGEASA